MPGGNGARMLILFGSAGWLLLAAPVAAPPRPAAPPEIRITRIAQLSIRERVIIRVPVRRPARAPQIVWQEKKGPRCIAMKDLAAAAITKASSVDLVLRGGGRVRAELESACPALEYYSGFYIAPTDDGMVCADRDAIHTRAGGECEIERFRKLVPKEK